MFRTNCLFCRGWTLALNIGRTLQTSQSASFQISESSWRRKDFLHVPTVGGKQLKDTDFVEPDTDEYHDIGEDTLDRAFDMHVGEEKEIKRRMRKIAIKRKFGTKVNQPNMLTWNERQHMIYLHELDPNEWTAEKLSECFPALPWTIKKILANKWIPDSIEVMKIKDQHVLENWEKLKRNELEAAPEVIEHLKKFIDRRENLRAQLKNPQFYYLPEKKQELPMINGPMGSILAKYEKEVNLLKKQSTENTLEAQGGEVMIHDHKSELSKLADKIEEEKKFIDTKNEDNFIIGAIRKRQEKDVTLGYLKTKILEKTDKKVQNLSVFEQAILDKRLSGQNRLDKGPEVSKESNTLLMTEDEDEPKNTQTSSRSTIRSVNKTEETPPIFSGVNLHDVPNDDRTKSINETELGEVFSRLSGSPEISEDSLETPSEQDNVTSKKVQKTAVNYYNTEKDKLHFKQEEEALMETCFWKAKGKLKRVRSEDAGQVIGINPSPHLSGEIQTYFTYDYPEKITIPKEERQKGKLYRVKDCYYDDDGRFLYRVPGMVRN